MFFNLLREIFFHLLYIVYCIYWHFSPVTSTQGRIRTMDALLFAP